MPQSSPQASRRIALQRLAGIGAGAVAANVTPLWAQTAKKGKLASKLRIVIPTPQRGGLDEAGRALGDALVGLGLCDEIEYENKDGKGGTVGLVDYVEKFSADPNTLFIGDTNLAGAAALQKSVVDMTRLHPIARLTSETMVVVVASSSPIKTLAELTQRLRTNPKLAPIAIGTPGSADHVFAGLLSKAADIKPEEALYVPHARNFEMIDAVLGGKTVAAVAAYGVFSPDVASGKLRALAVSSRRAAHGVRSATEQGVTIDLTPWRAVFSGQAVPAARHAEMVEAVKTAVTYDQWKKTLKQNFWEPWWLSGPDLTSFLDIDIKTVQLTMQLLKLKA